MVPKRNNFVFAFTVHTTNDAVEPLNRFVRKRNSPATASVFYFLLTFKIFLVCQCQIIVCYYNRVSFCTKVSGNRCQFLFGVICHNEKSNEKNLKPLKKNSNTRGARELTSLIRDFSSIMYLFSIDLYGTARNTL